LNSRAYAARIVFAHNLVHKLCAEIIRDAFRAHLPRLPQFCASTETALNSRTWQATFALAHTVVHRMCLQRWIAFPEPACAILIEMAQFAGALFFSKHTFSL
jgi:hypothetical protein